MRRKPRPPAACLPAWLGLDGRYICTSASRLVQVLHRTASAEGLLGEAPPLLRAMSLLSDKLPEMQSTVKAAIASAKAATSMDPVKLIASDGSEIIIDRRAALVSGTIKSMLTGPGASVAAASRPCAFHP